MPHQVVRFDDSLARLTGVVAAELGADALKAGVILRDAVGRLAFFSATPLDGATLERLSTSLRSALGSYARTDRVAVGSDDYGAKAILADPSASLIVNGEWHVRVLDRRLVGADWLRLPAPPAPAPPRIVFASLKGGVGRSTALSVVAAHLALHGKRILAVDLDMEAPGLGSVLLTNETLPSFGVVDALVENNLSGLDEQFLSDLIGPSALAHKHGVIDVMPAFGSRSVRNPADVLAKLARAYAEDVQANGTVATILDQVRDLVDRFSDPARYDVILVDARAGLHETTASSILGLGAEVLFFGLDEPQTFQGYSALFAHLARFLPLDGSMPEWIERLTMVQGKAPVDAEERLVFGQKCHELFEATGLEPMSLDVSRPVLLPAEPFKDVPWDESISDEDALPGERWMREPLAVLEDPRFTRFDPHRRQDLLSEAVYKTSFQQLLDRIDDVLKVPEVDS